MNTRDLSYIALSVALISVSAWIALPFGNIPVTMQTAVICLIAGLLGTKRAIFAVFTYILLGAIGAPIFAGFTGGVTKLVAPTGGYIIGFLCIAITVGIVSDLTKKVSRGQWIYLAAAMTLGIILCYVLGTVWFVFLTVQNGNLFSVWSALTLCVFPYLPFDVAKIVLAVCLTMKLKKIIKTV